MKATKAREARRNDPRRRRRRQFLLATIFLPVVFVTSLFSYSAGGFFDHLHKFNLAAVNGDQDLAKKEIFALEYYYELASWWKIQWLADWYFYENFYLRKAIITFMTGDFDKVIRDPSLQAHLDNHLVSQLMGAAKFRKAEGLYQIAKTKAEKNKVIKESVEDCEDFRRAAESGPGPRLYFPHSLNFDICVSPEDTKRVFENQGPPKIQLGYEPKQGDKDSEIDPTVPGGGSNAKKKG